MEKLSLDELEMVSGGVEINEDPQARKKCPACGAFLKKVAGGYQCLSCPGQPVYTEQQLKNENNAPGQIKTMSGDRNKKSPFGPRIYNA